MKKRTFGRTFIRFSCSITLQGKPLLVLQVGQSLGTLHALLHQLVVLLLMVGALALLMCAISSFLLTRRAFTTVQHLIQTARRIKAGDLRQRVSVPAAQDEIRALAVTLNGMLDALDQTMTRQRRFVADASHELRTPVAVIRNKTSIALLQPQKRQEYIAVLHEINTEASVSESSLATCWRWHAEMKATCPLNEKPRAWMCWLRLQPPRCNRWQRNVRCN
jgi:signal transduction histidine kinase